MILISNIVLEVLEGSTMPSTEIYGADKKTYINIGSGNVFNLKWDAPTLTNDIVDHYDLIIKRYDPTLNIYYNIFDKNIGLVNYFSINSDLLPAAPEQYLLHIYVVARGKNNWFDTSNVVTPYVCKGSGTYINTRINLFVMSRLEVQPPPTNNESGYISEVNKDYIIITTPEGRSDKFNGYTDTGKTLGQLCPTLKVDDKVKLSLIIHDESPELSIQRILYLGGEIGKEWLDETTITITKEHLSAPIVVYGSISVGEVKLTIQVEKDPEETGTSYMKRALGFVNIPTTSNVVATLFDITGRKLQILDSEGNPVPLETEATRLLSSDSWNIAQESHVKGTDGSWHKNNIEYEILLDVVGEIITDSSDEPIYIL